MNPDDIKNWACSVYIMVRASHKEFIVIWFVQIILSSEDERISMTSTNKCLSEYGKMWTTKSYDKVMYLYLEKGSLSKVCIYLALRENNFIQRMSQDCWIAIAVDSNGKISRKVDLLDESSLLIIWFDLADNR